MFGIGEILRPGLPGRQCDADSPLRQSYRRDVQNRTNPCVSQPRTVCAGTPGSQLATATAEGDSVVSRGGRSSRQINPGSYALLRRNDLSDGFFPW
jgi:hypothetical protein